MSGTALSAAMMKAYKEGLGVDFTLVCQGVARHVHSQVLDAKLTKPIFVKVIMARSPYLEAKVKKWCKEKKELVIDDCDSVTFNIIVEYMYGSPIPDSVVTSASDESFSNHFSEKLGGLTKLLQMSEMMQMVDLKGEVEELIVKNLDDTWSPGTNWSNVVTMGKVNALVKPAEQYNCEKLLLACARKYCRYSAAGKQALDMSTTTDISKFTPKFAAALIVAFSELAVPERS